VFPDVLLSNISSGASLTVRNAATGEYGLSVALFWLIPGIALAIGYSAFVYWRFAGKVS
jgi:cytochrome bd-type quinol oxidase subunit 2